jgi:ribosomal protein S19E (S16A)
MVKSFILRYEQKIKDFEAKLNKAIFDFLKSKKTCTTNEINEYLKGRHKEYKTLYEGAPAKALYRTKKVLKNLEKKGILKKSLSGSRVRNLQFLNYRWELIEK